MTYRSLTKCLACGRENLRAYFRAPDQPPANQLRPHGLQTVRPSYPLGLNVCLDCWHSQNLVAVDPEVLFCDYPYVSGTSQTLRAYFGEFVERVERDMRWTGPGHVPLRVLDIAANDGSLLAAFKARGHDVLGVDPAGNLQELSQANGVEVLPWFWEFVPEHRLGGKFDVIVAMNVLAHVENPALFLRLASLSLKRGGRIYVQTSQARMIERGEFDTVYHEHLSFFTSRSLDVLASRCDLSLVGLERVAIHGTSYLATMIKGVSKHGKFNADVIECADGYFGLSLYDSFQERASDRADQVRAAIEMYRAKGFRIVGYGAAAKAITFLNFAGIELDAMVDENPLKRDMVLPMQGTLISDLVGFRLLEMPPRILWVVGAWNFKQEIMGKINDARPGAQDAFLTWFPEVMIEDPEVRHE